MLILPAIDLLEGRCVRLHQGRFDRVKVYSEDPPGVARRFVEEGAEALHVVDLEGARLGKARNLESIYAIRESTSCFMEVGGGIRTLALASRLLDFRIDRLVLGTASAENPALLAKLAKRFGVDRIAAGLDLKGGRVAIEGWESTSAATLNELLINLEALGISCLICTDVARDGTLAGPGYDLAERLIAEGFEIIVAGGIATAEDIRRIRELGASGCIVGTAFYEGRLTVADALEAANAD